jgi:hypothetical protein
MLGLAGVKNTKDKIADVTVRVVLPEIVPEVAVIVAIPTAMGVATPALLTVATDVGDELHVTRVVISILVPSEYAPEAVNCWVSRPGMLGLAGVTDIEDKVAEVTVRIILADRNPEVAVMVVVPGATVVMRPVLLTVAEEGLDELQATRAVISKLVPSE